MTPWNNRNLTQTLERWHAGDDNALEEMVEKIYPLCHQMVAHRFGKRITPTFSQGDLLHEVLYRLSGMRGRDIKNSAHLHNLIAGMMLGEITDHYRKRNAAKRGGGNPNDMFDENYMNPKKATFYDKLLAEELLNKLAEVQPTGAYMFVYHHFFKENYAEVAARYGVSESTAQRRIKEARVWLLTYLKGEDTP